MEAFVAKLLLVFCVGVALTRAEFFAFTDEHDTSPSILLEGNFSITIKAFFDKKELASFTKHSSNTEHVQIDGGIGSRSFLYLRFSHSISWAFLFNTATKTDVSLDRLIQFVPHTVFPDISDITNSFQFDDPGITDIGSPEKSFACDHESVVQYYPRNVDPTTVNYTIHVTLRNFRAQAFNVKDGEFSPAVHCDADTTTTPSTSTVTTTAQTTTTTTTTTTATTTNTTASTKPTTHHPRPTRSTMKPSRTTTTPHPSTNMTTSHTPIHTTTPTIPTNPYVIRDNQTGKVCIAVSGKIEFDITYNATVPDKPSVNNLTSHIGIPHDFTETGECASGSPHESLTIFFFSDWYMKFEFELHSPSLLQQYLSDTSNNTKLDYSISNISLSYTIDHKHFPHAVEADGTRHTIHVSEDDIDQLPEKKKGESFYRCNSRSKITMGKDVSLKTSDLKFKAFNNNDDDGFRGRPVVCSADEDSDFDWPVVGYILLAFFLLILIIVVIYLIVRRKRKRRRGYRSI